MTQLTDKERTAAMHALSDWFKSQDINPQEAALVMLELIAFYLVNKTRNADALQDSCEIIRKALMLNCALFLKQKV